VTSRPTVGGLSCVLADRNYNEAGTRPQPDQQLKDALCLATRDNVKIFK